MDESELTAESVKMLWDMIAGVARTAQLIPIEDLNRLSEIISRAESIGPIVFPSEYLKGGATNLEEQRILLTGFRQFREAIDRVKEVGQRRNERKHHG